MRQSAIDGMGVHGQTSPQREQNLTRFGRRLADNDEIKVIVSEEFEQAEIVNYGDEGSESPIDGTATGTGPTPVIKIPVFTDIDCPYDGLSQREFYSILQYAEVAHEVGHYLKTPQTTVEKNFRELKEELSGQPMMLKQGLLTLARDIWNGLEDGAMERCMSIEKGEHIEQRLLLKNQCLIAPHAENLPVEQKQNVDLFFALHMTALGTKYDTGSLRRLLNEDNDTWDWESDEHKQKYYDLRPEIESAIQEIYTEPNPDVRTNKIFELSRSIIDSLIDEHPSPPEDATDRSKLRKNQTDDTENEFGDASSRSDGLNQQSKSDVAQQRANQTNAAVPAPDSDNTTRQDNTATGQAPETSRHTVADDTDYCPHCGSDNCTVTTQQTTEVTAQRFYPPVDPTQVGDMEYIYDDEKLGFRVDTTDLPQDQIKSNGYAIIEVSKQDHVYELLKPRTDESETLEHSICHDCGTEYVGTIECTGGDD